MLVQFSGLPSLQVRWKALRNSHLAHATSGCYLEGYLPGPAPSVSQLQETQGQPRESRPHSQALG